MSNWQEAAAAKLDNDASWWYMQTVDKPDVQRTAEELWGIFWEGKTEEELKVKPLEDENYTFGTIEITTRGIDSLRQNVPTTLAEAIGHGAYNVLHDGREISVRVMASEMCRRALVQASYANAMVDVVEIASPASAGEIAEAA